MEEGIGGVGLKMMVMMMKSGVSDLSEEIVFFEGGRDDDCGMFVGPGVVNLHHSVRPLFSFSFFFLSFLHLRS